MDFYVAPVEVQVEVVLLLEGWTSMYFRVGGKDIWGAILSSACDYVIATSGEMI